MKGLIVLACTLAVAASSPTFGLLGGGSPGPHGVPLGVGHHIGGIGGGPLGGVGHHIGGIGGVPGPGGVIGAVGNAERAKLDVVGKVLGGVGGRIPADKGFRGQGEVYPVYGGGLGQGWAFFVRGITDVAGNAGSIFKDLLSLKIPGALDDSLNGFISVARALGGILNALLPGLGTLFGNIVVSLGKILICVLGSPGISGAVIGDRRPGRDNPVDIPYICRRDWGKNYGWNYDGDHKRDLIIKYYKAQKSLDQCNKLINIHTNGRGVESTSGSVRIVFEAMLNLAAILDRDSSTWTPRDIDSIQIQVAIVLGVLGNSHQPGLGPILIREWIRHFKNSKGPKRGATDLSRYQDEIFRGIQGAEEDRWSGAFDNNKRGDWDQIRKSTEEDNSTDNTSTNDYDQSNSNSFGKQNQSSDNGNSSSSDDTSDSNSNNNRGKKSDSSDQSSGSNSNNRRGSKSDSSDESSGSNSNTSRGKKSDSSDESNDSFSNNNKGKQSDSSDQSSESNSNNRRGSKSDSSDESSGSNSNTSRGKKSDSSDESSGSNSNTSRGKKSDSSDESSGSNSNTSRGNKSDFSDKSSDSNNKNNKGKQSDSSDVSSTSTSKNNKGKQSDSSDVSSTSTSKNNKDSSNQSDASNNNNNQNGNSNSPTGGSESTDESETSGDGSYKLHDKSFYNNKASDQKNSSASSSGSGKKIVNKDGSSVEEYNFQNANAQSSSRASETTDAREHQVERTSDD